MALSSAEKVRRFRERQKDVAKQTAHVADAFQKQPFDEYLGDLWEGEILFDFDLLGIDRVDFPGKGNIDPFWQEDWGEGPNRGAIGCAERMVGVLLEAAGNLARRINRYKTEQFNARIAELEASDLSDPDARKQALADIVKLTKYRDQLEKQVRLSLPQWKVKGE